MRASALPDNVQVLEVPPPLARAQAPERDGVVAARGHEVVPEGAQVPDARVVGQVVLARAGDAVPHEHPGVLPSAHHLCAQRGETGCIFVTALSVFPFPCNEGD